MIIIKNSKELAELVDKNKDLFLQGDNVRIEFKPSKKELRDVCCRNLFLINDNERFDFNGRNFDGWDFKGRDFNGGDFNGRDFDGSDFYGSDFDGQDFYGLNFNGWNFNGESFNGEHISYYVWFIAYGDIKCRSIKGRRKNSFHKSLDGKLIIKEEKYADKKVKVKK